MQTMHHLLIGAGLDKANHRIYQDPRLREVDHGYSDIEAQETMRKEHGWFYYRFNGGESPADCYDRCCHFLESLMRQILRKSPKSIDEMTRTNSGFGVTDLRPNPLIVMHGLTMRCFATRFMHLTVDQFETLANPKNGDIIRIAHLDKLRNPQFGSGKWGIEGLRFRSSDKEMSALA